MNARFLGDLSVLVLLGLVAAGATGPRCEPVPVEPCPP